MLNKTFGISKNASALFQNKKNIKTFFNKHFFFPSNSQQSNYKFFLGFMYTYFQNFF